MQNTILSFNKVSCTGCGACDKQCEQNAITMIKTQEGFYYPFIDDDKCIKCGKCAEVCCLNGNTKGEQGTSYCFKASDSLRWRSDNGSVFLFLAEKIIEQNGKIYAPFFVDDYNDVKYRLINNTDELDMLCNIQYVQANPFEAYDELKTTLDNGDIVLFFGIPCAVAGIKLMLKYSNLYTVDTICHGISSGNIWSKFIDEVRGQYGISRLKLSSKELGINESIRIYLNNSENDIYEEFSDGNWISSFNSGLTLRKSCYSCSYNSANRQGDFTVGNMSNIKSALNDGKGISYLGVNSEKGMDLFKSLSNTDDLSYEKTTWENANTYLKATQLPIQNENRKKFFEISETQSFGHAIRFIKSGVTAPQKFQRTALDFHSGDKAKWTILNNDVWKKLQYDTFFTLLTNGTKWQRIFLTLNFTLIKGFEYKYDIKFKAVTSAKDIRFMLSDSAKQGSKSTIITTTSVFDKWTRITGTFTCSMDNLNYLMLASTDFIGNNSLISFDWIRITEC